VLKRAGAWKGSYLDNTEVVPRDPWGNAYLYVSSDGGKSCSVSSLGADGRVGGKGYGAEISVSLPRE
ncbi:type II secretion system protein GspG, partial [Acetobacter lovaniensis]|uniref:type II secretion system protein GspG n=1 Tax=Acetobacter lovaniensis TaxID=104100 RepID=UPI00376F5144